jgi:hypothetical protein
LIIKAPAQGGSKHSFATGRNDRQSPRLKAGYFPRGLAATLEYSAALLKFEVVLLYRLGYPNDEVLRGRSLSQFGVSKMFDLPYR